VRKKDLQFSTVCGFEFEVAPSFLCVQYNNKIQGIESINKVSVFFPGVLDSRHEIAMQMKRRRKIPTFVSSLLIVSSAFRTAANELPSIPYPFDHIAEQNYLNIPLYHDKWCKDVCNSQSSCSDVFHNDTLDLRIRTRHSILDGPGQHLLFQKKVFGDTIARQNFDTQFILDMSNTLDVSPCKVYIKDVLAEEDPLGLSWDVDHVLISFQLFNISIDKIKDLTRQSQDKLSLLYKGKVSWERERDDRKGLFMAAFQVRLILCR